MINRDRLSIVEIDLEPKSNRISWLSNSVLTAHHKDVNVLFRDREDLHCRKDTVIKTRKKILFNVNPKLFPFHRMEIEQIQVAIRKVRVDDRGIDCFKRVF